MNKSEQHEGLLIRYAVRADTLLIVLEDCQGGFPRDLAEELREITIHGLDASDLDQEGLKKSVGDDFWVTVGSDWAEIGADFMPEQRLRASAVTVTRRQHSIDDLRALYSLMRKALTEYQTNYGLECRKTANLQTGISKFISARHDRLAAKVEFFSEREPVKAAHFSGMLTLLEELQKELGR